MGGDNAAMVTSMGNGTVVTSKFISEVVSGPHIDNTAGKCSGDKFVRTFEVMSASELGEGMLPVESDKEAKMSLSEVAAEQVTACND